MSCVRRIRFSVTKYSFLIRSSSSTDPVMYANSFFQSMFSTTPVFSLAMMSVLVKCFKT